MPGRSARALGCADALCMRSHSPPCGHAVLQGLCCVRERERESASTHTRPSFAAYRRAALRLIAHACGIVAGVAMRTPCSLSLGWAGVPPLGANHRLDQSEETRGDCVCAARRSAAEIPPWPAHLRIAGVYCSSARQEKHGPCSPECCRTRIFQRRASPPPLLLSEERGLDAPLVA